MGRAVAASVLIVVGCVLAPLSVAGVWARTVVTDTDRYVETVAPLASDPTIQNAITDRVTGEVLGHLDIDGLVSQAIDALATQGLPPRVAGALRGLAGSVGSGVEGFVSDQVARIVDSDVFVQVWADANRVAHDELVLALSGDTSGAVTVHDGTVNVELGGFVEAVKQRLVDAGFTIAERIPDANPQFTIIHSEKLDNAQTAFRLVERLGVVLPVVTLGLLTAGVLAARERRRALARAGLGVAVAMVVLAAALAIGRGLYLDRLPAGVSLAAAGDVFDTLVRFLRTGLRTVLAAGLVVAVGAYLAGPSSTAVRARSAFRGLLGRRAGNAWVYENRGPLRVAVIGVASLTFVFWDHPTGKVVLLLAVLTLAAFAVIELVAGRGAFTRDG